MRPPQHPIALASQVGNALHSARKARKLSQAQLAARMGLSQNRLSELERNPGALSLDQLLALCAQLGLQLSLHSRDDAPPSAHTVSDADAAW